MRRALGGLLLLSVVGCGVRLPGRPVPPMDPTPAEVAAKQYATNCAACHGEDGRLGVAPPLNDPLFLAIVPDAELVKVILRGRDGTPMPGFDKAKGGPFDEAQAKELAKEIKLRWGDAKKADGAPPYLDKGGGDAAAGKKLFAAACAQCHGDDGRGERHAINDQALLGLMTNQAIRRIIITGRPDLGMPSYAGKPGRPAEFAPLTDKDVSDLTAFVASWRKSVGEK